MPRIAHIHFNKPMRAACQPRKRCWSFLCRRQLCDMKCAISQASPHKPQTYPGRVLGYMILIEVISPNRPNLALFDWLQNAISATTQETRTCASSMLITVSSEKPARATEALLSTPATRIQHRGCWYPGPGTPPHDTACQLHKQGWYVAIS